MENENHPESTNVSLHVPDHDTQTFRSLETLWRQQMLCDVVLESNGHSILGHRVVLAACSPYLNSLLSQHQTSSAAQVSIQFDSALHNVLCILIEFMYTGEIKLQNCTVQDVIVIAEEFGMTSFVKSCRNYQETGKASERQSLSQKASMFATVYSVIDNVLTRAVNLVEKKRGQRKQIENTQEAASHGHAEDDTWHVSRVSGRKCTRPKRFVDSVNLERSVHSLDDVDKNNENSDDEDEDYDSSTSFNDNENDQCNGDGLDDNSVNFNLKCGKCFTQFGSLYEFYSHKTSCRELPHKTQRRGPTHCNKCRQDFKNRKTLNDHRRKCVGQKKSNPSRRYKCQYCDYRHFAQKSVDLHMNSKHEVPFDERYYKILKCKTHINRIHQKQPKFKCSQCSFTSYLKNGIMFHQYKKHGVPLPPDCRWFKCKLCDYSTTSNSQFTAHSRRHTGEKPMECRVCEKNFVDKSALREHMKWHTGIRNYKCTYEGCHQACMNNAKLQEHIRLIHTHKGEKPWACHLCSYCCAVKGNLTKHLRSTHRMHVMTKQRRVQQMSDGNTVRENATIQANHTTQESTSVPEKEFVVNILPENITDEALVAADIIALSESAFNQANQSLLG